MSQLQLYGDPSGNGTITIQSPNTNSNRTLTLPDSTGTLHTGVGGIKAWGSFNGTGTVAVISGGNFSSVTDLGTGSYRVNFTSALSSNLYAVMAAAKNNGSGRCDCDIGTKTTTYFEMTVTLTGINTLTDSSVIDFMVVQ